MKISQSFSAALKLLFLNAEKTQSCSFIHPTKGVFNVKITKDNRFISTHIKTAAKSQSESITYYGNFLHAVGQQLNVRIDKSGLFEIRRPGTFKHLGYTNILEIVHPTRGLQLVQKRGVEFNIARLDKVVPPGLLMPARALAISLPLQDNVSKQIKRIINTGLFVLSLTGFISSQHVEDFDKKAQLPLDNFHLGLMDLQGTVPEPHYNIIKRKFMRIVKHTKIGTNQQSITQQGFSEFRIEATKTGTILMLPTKEQPYQTINTAMKKALDQVNGWFKTGYLPNSFTAEKYQPHITLLHGDALRALKIDPTIVAKKLNALFQKSALKIKFVQSPQYKLFPVNKTTAYLIKLTKTRLTKDLTKTASTMLLSKELSAAFLVAGIALLASASGNASFLLGLLFLILSVVSITHNLRQPLAQLYKQSCAFFFNAAQNTNAILENTAEATKALRDPIKKARINIDPRVESLVKADVSTNICILQ
jgi:hypothetical protein